MVTWNYPPKLGGMEVMIARIVAGLRRHMRVQVVGPCDPARPDESDTVRASRGGLAWFMLIAIFTGWRLLRRDPIELLIGGSALMTPVLFVLSRPGKRPFMIIVHGLDLVYEHPLYQFMLRKLLPQGGLCDCQQREHPAAGRAVGCQQGEHPSYSARRFVAKSHSRQTDCPVLCPKPRKHYF